MFISGLLIISFLISLIYFAIELVKTQKGYTAIPVLINLLVLLIGFTFFNEIKLREYNFNKYADVRNEIIEMIVEGELSIDEKGRIEILNTMKSDEVERRGYVELFRYGNQIGGYFCSATGILGNSSGYLYLFSNDELDFDLLSENIFISLNRKVTLAQNYGEKWYFCITE